MGLIPGVTAQIHNLVFGVLGGWLRSGDFTAAQVGQTPLFPALFEALASDELFDAAVDTICELVHETQEVHDNQAIIEQIIPRIIALRPQLDVHKEDDDRVRGYCRIFCEAGETYVELITKHPHDLLPLVEAIASCAAYPDLDIVPITFNFWYVLASAMGRQNEDPSLKPLFDIFEALQTIIIGHLHFPAEDDHVTAHQRDDFRAFRHKMGDTLKDCCHVLGGSVCLSKSYDLVVAAMHKPQPTWQEIEAPLFSMRSMGAEIDPGDDEVLPKIMDLLPSLPQHPRVLYAAILVISRYTLWTDRHPQYIESHIRYLVRGFEMNEPDVAAAAAMAMKFMCQDCAQHLVPHIEQLHQFTSQTSGRVGQADMLEIWEALGYVVADMPAEQAAPAIQQFTQPLFARIQAIVQDPAQANKATMQELSGESSATSRDDADVVDNFEQIDSFLSVIRTLQPVPEACYATVGPLYQLVDQVIARYGNTFHVAERAGSVVRRGLAFFPRSPLEPLLESVLSRMVTSFRDTGFASYLWIIGKTADKFGQGPGGEELSANSAALFAHAFEGVCTELQKLVAVKPAPMIPDGECYLLPKVND
jgi:transportin-3